MSQSELKSYHLGLEEIEDLLQNQYGSSIQPINYEKLRQVRIQQARSAAFTANLRNEKTGTDALDLENINQKKID